MCSCYLLVTFGEGKGGKRLLPGCSAGTQLPICHRTGSRGVGSGCGGGSFHAFWPPEPAKKDRKMPGNINHVKCQRLAGDGEGEVGAGGCGSHGRVCSLGLQPSVSKCTLIYIRRSQPHLLMHQQIWALLLPLSPQHSSAHLGCWDRAGRAQGACGTESWHIPGIVMLSWVCTHSRPSPFLGPTNPYSLHKTPPVAAALGCSRLQDSTPAAGFLDPATSLNPGRTLGIIKFQKGVEEKQGCISLSLFLTRGGLTIDPVPLKPLLGGAGTVTICVFTPRQCWR